MNAQFLKLLGGWLGVPTLIALLFTFGNGAIPSAESQSALLTPTPLPTSRPLREPAGVTPHDPNISFIDSQSAMCYRPVPGTGTCYLAWNYLYVTASSGQYVISMTVAIDGGIRAYQSGFFQTYMYIPGDMYGRGFKVTCGLPGASGDPLFGKSYRYEIRARETGGLAAANYGTVVCPADASKLFLPNILR
ncbi:MAG: hypothetical protein HZB51_14545 [Chloroflexi bacterium]|nr:hypothetical protein [Chloroflexota bacterium]